jgi:hypothetical protein
MGQAASGGVRSVEEQKHLGKTPAKKLVSLFFSLFSLLISLPLFSLSLFHLSVYHLQFVNGRPSTLSLL